MPKRRSGAEQIAAERARQVIGEGYTAEHDDNYGYEPLNVPGGDDLARAASCYADPHDLVNRVVSPPGADRSTSKDVPRRWPWHPSCWKPERDRIRQLVKAGALIAAEIDRLQRAALQNSGEEG